MQGIARPVPTFLLILFQDSIECSSLDHLLDSLGEGLEEWRSLGDREGQLELGQA